MPAQHPEVPPAPQPLPPPGPATMCWVRGETEILPRWARRKKFSPSGAARVHLSGNPKTKIRMGWGWGPRRRERRGAVLSQLSPLAFLPSRRFGTKCAGCSQGISPSDLVRKARNKVFHLNCFTCMVCNKQLSTGEELYIIDENKFVCKEDYLNSPSLKEGSLNSGTRGAARGNEPQRGRVLPAPHGQRSAPGAAPGAAGAEVSLSGPTAPRGPGWGGWGWGFGMRAFTSCSLRDADTRGARGCPAHGPHRAPHAPSDPGTPPARLPGPPAPRA